MAETWHTTELGARKRTAGGALAGPNDGDPSLHMLIRRVLGRRRRRVRMDLLRAVLLVEGEPLDRATADALVTAYDGWDPGDRS